jgi:ATP-binding cassette subfamily F protein 3
MISVENLNKSFGKQVLFQDASFKINPRERVGLVGRNGHGKTTLFRLIVGDDTQDSGTITFPKHYRIGYVRQQLEFTEATVLAEGLKSLPDHEKDHYWKVEKILAGLDFTDGDWDRDPHALSGGFQVRLNLAKALVSEPDLLLLDEPTNYLDIASIRWVERFLLNWPHELMLITHNRGLMDKLVTHVVGIHRRRIRKIEGNTKKYYEQMAQEEEIHEKTRLKDERRRKEIELFITRFRAKARLANLVQSRIKTLEKTKKREKLETIKTLDFSFQSIPFPGKTVLTAEDVSFSYDTDKPLIRNLSITVNAGDRVCLIGKNGKGKTTLLRILGGNLKPQNGRIVYHPVVKKGLFEQTNLKSLVDERTVEEEIQFSNPDAGRQHSRNICGAMMFEGSAALKKIGVLSGGEKSRVMLGKLLITPLNLLFLDEPTNHLDIDSCDALLAAIENFDGTVVMVTHNEMFLHAIARRLIVFQNDGIDVFEGTYAYFLEKEGWADEAGAKQPDHEELRTKKANTKPTKKELKRLRAEILSERSRKLKPIENRISELENDIESNENRLSELSREMMKASSESDGLQIQILSKAIHECRATVDRLFEELESSTDLLEEQSAEFDKRLEDLASSALT